MRRVYPDIILEPPRPRSLDSLPPPTGVQFTDDGKIWDDEGREIPPQNFFTYLLGKRCYGQVPRHLGDLIFRSWTSAQVRQLYVLREIEFPGWITVSVSGPWGNFMVRKGNKYGWFYRLNTFPQCRTDPKGLRGKIEQLERLIQTPVRTTGQTWTGIVSNWAGWQDLNSTPPRFHCERFLRTFRAGRIEGCIFGRSEDVYYHDLRSAFPSVLAECLSTHYSVMDWKDSPEYHPEAFYGCMLVDLWISEGLSRGPIPVLLDEGTQYFPVGRIEKVWINKQEYDFLQKYPEIGKIERIYEGSWGIPKRDNRPPFKGIVSSLFQLRSDPANEQLARHLKVIMTSAWGKTLGTYQTVLETNQDFLPTKVEWRAPFPYNPAIADYVTGVIRLRLYESQMGTDVVSEIIDGGGSLQPLKEGEGVGMVRLEGRGQMVLFSDFFRYQEWKPSTNYILDLAQSQAHRVETLKCPSSRFIGVGQLYHRGRPPSVLGTVENFTRRIGLGPSNRTMDYERILTVGDYLSYDLPSDPPGGNGRSFWRTMNRNRLKDGLILPYWNGVYDFDP